MLTRITLIIIFEALSSIDHVKHGVLALVSEIPHYKNDLCYDYHYCDLWDAALLPHTADDPAGPHGVCGVRAAPDQNEPRPDVPAPRLRLPQHRLLQVPRRRRVWYDLVWSILLPTSCWDTDDVMGFRQSEEAKQIKLFQSRTSPHLSLRVMRLLMTYSLFQW